MLPFTREQFFAVFAAYNDGIWPAQLAAYGLGAAAVALLFRPSARADRAIAGIVAAMWVWTGVAYHWLYFSRINKAALLFGALFLAEGVALVHAGVVRHRVRFRVENGPAAWLGGFFIAYAAVVYPLIGLWMGHGYAETPVFGVTPCPVTIFTLGMFLVAARPVSPWLLVVPFAWSLVGGSAAVVLAVPQDWLLLLSVVAIPLIVRYRRVGVTDVS